jgi:hypothetical protein
MIVLRVTKDKFPEGYKRQQHVYFYNKGVC